MTLPSSNPDSAFSRRNYPRKNILDVDAFAANQRGELTPLQCITLKQELMQQGLTASAFILLGATVPLFLGVALFMPQGDTVNAPIWLLVLGGALLVGLPGIVRGARRLKLVSAARDEAQSINRKKNQLRSLLRGYNPVLSRVFPSEKFHHPAVYALLQQSVFPEEFVAAGVEALTRILTHHSRSAFGAEQAQQLVDQCRGLISRPMRREVVHQRVNDLIAEIQLAHQHQKALLKAGYALIHDRPEAAKLLKASTGVSNTLALVSEVSDVQRFPDGEHVASFLGLTTKQAHFRHDHLSVQTHHQARSTECSVCRGQHGLAPEPAGAQVSNHVQNHQSPQTSAQRPFRGARRCCA